MVQQTKRFTKEDVQNELAKCDLLCANCHELEHWTPFEGWEDLIEEMRACSA